MREKREIIDSMLTTYINSIGREDSIFSNSLKKWRTLILNLAYRNALKTGTPIEDFFQDIMVHLVEANARYNFAFYRYKGKLYEIVFKDNDFVYLKSNPFNKRDRKQILVNRKEVEEVQKGKHASFIYRRLNQFCFEAVTSHFTKKNGYEIKEEEGLVITRSGKRSRKTEKKTLKKPIKLYHTKSFENISELKLSDFPSPEELVITEDLYAKSVSRFPSKSQKTIDNGLKGRYTTYIDASPEAKKSLLRELNEEKYTKCPVYLEEFSFEFIG